TAQNAWAADNLRCLQFFPRAFTIRSRLFRKWLLYYSHQEKKEVLHMKSLKKWSLVIALALVVASVGGYCYMNQPAQAESAGSETATYYSVADIAEQVRPAV